MKANHQIILHPVISEKGTALNESQNKYIFAIDPKANKIEVKKAIEEMFKVKVLNVNTANVSGKKKRIRQQLGMTSAWKKAIITLREGDKIQFI
ncbi:50S ribosomal protein L23 [Chlamydiota bacterium]